ncbi:MAG: subtilisin family serine protease [Planctomycetota bacterium]|jgi:subtilisin family serine protease
MSQKLFLKVCSALTLGLFGIGCSGGGGGGSATGLSGLLSLPAGSGGVIVEAEPNDSVDQSHDLGTISAGQTIEVLGSITDDGSDPFDGFSLLTEGRLEFSVSLDFDAGVDLDMMVYDPVPMQFVEVFDSGGAAPEVGSFVARGSFDLVMSSFSGASSYRLTITASVPSNPILEDEPNDSAGDAQYLGAGLPGDSLALAGSVNSSTDAQDRWLLVFTEATDATFTMTVPGGADFELDLNDATGDLGSPTDLFMSNTGVGVTVNFTYSVAAMTALEVVVVAESGSGPYSLGLGLVASLTGGGGLGGAEPALLRLPTNLSLEGGSTKSSSRLARYGRAPLEAMAGELLLALEDDVDPRALAAAQGLNWIDGVPGGVQRFRLPMVAGVSAEDARRLTTTRARVLGATSGVRYAEENWMRQRLDTPNDPFFNLQWHYPLIQVPAAWDLTLGSSAVITAVIDTGELAHPDLIANQIAGYDFISDPNISLDGNGRDSDPTDEGDGGLFNPSSFHGTHVAGTIGAATNNGVGVAGINRMGKIMHLRTLGKGGGTTFDIINALLYAARLPNASNTLPPNAAKIVNMSLGGPGFSQSFQDACTDAWDAGVVIFAASGNENSSTPSYPAAYADVISVAAVDQNAVRAGYSNFHASVDIAAPGGNTGADVDGDGYADGVLSTLADDSGSSLSFNYVFYQGTSMACPHAAGVAGLMLAANGALSPDQVEMILESTATDLGSAGKDNLYGNGLINAYQAVLQAQGGAPTDPVLGLSTTSLSFPSGVQDLSVQISNLGGGQLQVTNVVASTSSGGAWLSATAVASSTSNSTDTSSIAVSVNRAVLADGVYTGSVRVDSNAIGTSSETILVSLVVAPDAPPNVEVFVLVVEFDLLGNPSTVAQAIVNPATGLDYSFRGLPEGSYLVVAGTDADDDDLICDDGETYCGIYPNLDDPVLVDVEEGEVLRALDFVLVDDGASVGSSGASSDGSPHGFRLMADQ